MTLYRHYKGKLYKLLGIGAFGEHSSGDILIGTGVHSEDYFSVAVYQSGNTFVLEASNPWEGEHVVYQGQYNCEKFGERPIFIRPKDMFFETVVIDGKEVERFSLQEEPGTQSHQ